MTVNDLLRACNHRVTKADAMVFLILMRAYEDLQAEEQERAHEAAMEGVYDNYGSGD